jgi:hypothetical protein
VPEPVVLALPQLALGILVAVLVAGRGADMATGELVGRVAPVLPAEFLAALGPVGDEIRRRVDRAVGQSNSIPVQLEQQIGHVALGKVEGLL